MKNNNDLPKYTKLNVYLPVSVLADSNVYCLYNNLVISCSYNPTNHAVNVDYFSDSDILVNSFNSADLLIGNLYNPPSTRLTSSFQFEFINLNNEII